MHPKLKIEFDRLKSGQIELLNLLTELGIISDLVVVPEDIANSDAEFAAEILSKFMTTAELPTYTEKEYEDAKAVSDTLLETIQTNAALGLSDPTLDSEFSRALRKTRFLRRRLAEQKTHG